MADAAFRAQPHASIAPGTGQPRLSPIRPHTEGTTLMSQHPAPARYVYPGAPILVIAGLAIAVTGGWLWLHTGPAAKVCSQGFVLLTATQLLGAAIALAGCALAITALVLALRQRPEP